MKDLKEIKVLHTDTEVNEYLEKGWIIVKILSNGIFVLGLEK